MIRNSTRAIPRYLEVYNALMEQIRRGDYSGSVPLPPERQLAEDFGVSRITIVKALDLLKQAGVIDRQHGRGTFIREQTEPLNDPVHPFRLKPTDQGAKPDIEWRVSRAGFCPAPARVVQALHAGRATDHFEVSVDLLMEKQLVGRHHVGIHEQSARAEQLEQRQAGELLDFIRQFLGTQALERQYAISARVASWPPDDATGSSQEATLLTVDTLYTDKSGEIIVFARSSLLADLFYYSF